jgi:hypothetical protein
MDLKFNPQAHECHAVRCRKEWTVAANLDSYFGRRFGRAVKFCDEHLALAHEPYERPGMRNNCGHYSMKDPSVSKKRSRSK